MKFPRAEADVIALVRSIIKGLQESSHFPSPPVSSSDLQNLLDSFLSARDANVMSYAAAQQSTEIKNIAYEAMVLAARSDLHYAEDLSQNNDAKLAELGWGAKAPPVPHVLELPGQPQNVRAAQQEKGTLQLQWEEPALGGAAAYYEVRRSLAGEEGGAGALVGTSMETSIALTEQPRGKALEYRVFSVNKTGRSLPGNTVVVML